MGEGINRPAFTSLLFSFNLVTGVLVVAVVVTREELLFVLDPGNTVVFWQIRHLYI